MIVNYLKKDILSMREKSLQVLANILFYIICVFSLYITESDYWIYCCVFLLLCMSISFHIVRNEKSIIQFVLLQMIQGIQIYCLYYQLNYFKIISTYGTLSIISENLLYITVLLTFFCIFKKLCKIEIIFLIDSICFGLFMMCSLPVKSAPDEITHIYTSYNLSNKILHVETSEGKIPICEEDQALLLLPIEYGNSLEIMNGYYQLSLSESTDSMLIFDASKCLSGDTPAYVMSALGISVGRIFNLNAFWTLTLGRLFNLVQYIGLVYFAIKVMPYSKYLPMAIALLPIAMQQGMSYSYDSLVIALSIFVICGALGYKYNNQIDKQSKKILGLSVVLFSTVLFFLKSNSYMFIALSPVFIALSNSAYFKKISKLVLRVIIIGIALFLLYMIADMCVHFSPFLAEPSNPISWKDEVQGYTIQYFLNEPLDLMKVYVNTFLKFLPFYIASSISYDLGWVNIQPPVIFILVFLVLTYLSLESKETNMLNKFERKYLIFSIVSTIFCILMAFAISWTPKGEGAILGVQGRYFIPLFITIFLLISSKRDYFKNYRVYIPIMYSIAIMVFSVFLITRF